MTKACEKSVRRGDKTMKGWQRVLLCLLVMAGLVFAPRVARAGGDDDYAGGEVVVTLKAGASIAAVGARYGTSVVEQLPGTTIYLLRLPAGLSVEQALKQMQGDRDIQSAEPDYSIRDPEAQQFSLAFDGEDALPDDNFGNNLDARYLGQLAVARIGLPQALTRTRGAGVVVAVLDTGVDASHPALAGRILTGWDYVDGDADPSDLPNGRDDDGDALVDESAGHGTFMAGIIALVAPDARILPLRVLDSDGRGSVFRLARAIMYAVDNRVQVINLSLSRQRDIQLLEDAVSYAVAHNVVVVAAVGNRRLDDHSGSVLYPAAYPAAVAVAATDGDDLKAAFSNWGKETDLSAPGTSIYSTYLNHGYAWWSGTSSATALVAGGMALLRAEHPGWSASQVIGRLKETAVNIDALNYRDLRGKLGAGRINLDAATR